uniref:Uncharacterized protein n=1 Tax=Oryza punctata TaxID=4537 RepID=A0A0E0LA19_ORYPU
MTGRGEASAAAAATRPQPVAPQRSPFRRRPFPVPDPASASSLVREPPLRSGVEVAGPHLENDFHDSCFEVNLSWKNSQPRCCHTRCNRKEAI